MSANWNIKRGLRLRELDGPGLALPGLQIELDPKTVDAVEQFCARFPALLKKSMEKATRQTRTGVRRYVTKRLVAVTTLTPAYVVRAVTARRRGEQHEVRVASPQIPLIRYKVTPLIQRKKGVPVKERPRIHYKLRHGGNLFTDTARGLDVLPGKKSQLFTAAMESGHLGVFYRMKESGKLVEKRGPSLQWHAYADNIIPEVQEYGRQSLFRNLENELNRLGVSRL